MTLLVVLVLVVAWTWFGWVTWRDRRNTTGRGANSIASFNRHLSVLERATPSWRTRHDAYSSLNPISSGADLGPAERLSVLATGRPLPSVNNPIAARLDRTLRLSEAQQRRRRFVFGLATATATALLLALVARGIFVPLAVIVGAAFVAYVGLLLRARSVEIERALKVRTISRNAEDLDVLGGNYEEVEDLAVGYHGPSEPASGYRDASYGRRLVAVGSYDDLD